jgi:hypothetical protein
MCQMGLLATTSAAIDGSKFKAVNNRDKNFTRAKVERRRAQLEESVARYLSQLDTADREEPTEALATKVTRLALAFACGTIFPSKITALADLENLAMARGREFGSLRIDE